MPQRYTSTVSGAVSTAIVAARTSPLFARRAPESGKATTSSRLPIASSRIGTLRRGIVRPVVRFWDARPSLSQRTDSSAAIRAGPEPSEDAFDLVGRAVPGVADAFSQGVTALSVSVAIVEDLTAQNGSVRFGEDAILAQETC